MDAEADAGLTRKSEAHRTAIVNRHLRAEADHAHGQVVGDEGLGVGADAVGIDLACDRKGAALVVFADKDLAVGGLSGLPTQRGEGAGGTVGHHQDGLDPVGPVAALVAAVVRHEMELLRAAQVGADLDKAGLGVGSDEG